MPFHRLTRVFPAGLVLTVVFALVIGCRTAPRPAAAPVERPNFIVIFCDDLGYADIGPFGSATPTPHLDRLAREGMKFTSFYSAQAVCSAARAALLTGCYPNRVGIIGALGPNSKTGLHPDEVTLAEVLRQQGYATAIYGKWHLGDAPEFLPTRHGFDEFFGLPYSNDMWPHHPTNGRNYPPLPLIENDRVAQFMPDQEQLTTLCTERAVGFIERNAHRPFFLYLPHPMPHVPLFVSDKFKGRTGRGLYADVIAEIDWSVGRILEALQRHGLDERTMVIFTSDNGPWLLYGNHAGSATPLREGKATSFDGGVRVPMLARWPGRIPAGAVCHEPSATIDLFPTLARLAGTTAPQDRIIDGRDIRSLLAGRPGSRDPQHAYYFYWGRELHAVRSGSWKLHLSHKYPQPSPPGGEGRPGAYATRETKLALFNLARDPREVEEVGAEHPAVVRRMLELAERARADLGDALTQRAGSNLREPGRLP